MANPFYKDYSEYISEFFPGVKMQKISVNAGFSCPNRDGSIGTGGCSYCSNASFTPSYCLSSDSVADQLLKGKDFFSRKYPQMKYLAYFQSFTNTYGNPARLRRLWEEALGVEDVFGLIVGTRPDSLGDEALGQLAEIARRLPVFLELGAESSFDETLRRVNRGHTWQSTVDTVRRASDAGLHVGIHLIAGLPGEDEEMALTTVERACALPIESIKLHHLQIIKGTPLFSEWERGEVTTLFPDAEDYLDFCLRVVDIVPRHIAIERFLASSPPAMVASPRWGLKNHEFVDRLHRRLASR